MSIESQKVQIPWFTNAIKETMEEQLQAKNRNPDLNWDVQWVNKRKNSE